MSFANLLSPPTSTPPEVAVNQPVLAPPSSPTKATTTPNEEKARSSDTVMSDFPEPEVADESAEGGNVVDDADREFTCMNDEYTPCQTGQYTKDLSRKVISDHFGRNKACTRDITDWPLFCRKHYQRATYNKELWQVRKVKLILRQIDIIERQFPGTTYDVQFKKSEEVRLNLYSRQVAAGMKAEESAKTVAPKAGKHFEASINVLRELDQYLGKDKSTKDVKDIVDVISQMLESKDTEQVPSIEFLPQLPGKVTSPKKAPAKARASKSPKTLRTPKTVKTPKTPSRVSAKGSVKKTLQKS
ncbi:hypothetical protein BKA66DRAFT_463585 [Pyrenochaeta sp. MPI-SDFR-AT-0127]|nr:hypothetical protein BKA66DRAFT_463585 [Pyrenochaeta sp. MPI-SDFR-AT-0127]